MNTRDSHLPRALKLDAFLAMQCLGDKILAAVKSSVTFMTTRSTWLPPRLSLVAAIMVDGSVKWRGVSITYTAVRDADASAERDGRVDGISRHGIGGDTGRSLPFRRGVTGPGLVTLVRAVVDRTGSPAARHSAAEARQS